MNDIIAEQWEVIAEYLGNDGTSIAEILCKDYINNKVPLIGFILKWIRYKDDEICATVQDPSGEMEVYFHHDVVTYLGNGLITGNGIIVKNSTIYLARNKKIKILNIVPNNIQYIFSKNNCKIILRAAVKNMKSEIKSANIDNSVLDFLSAYPLEKDRKTTTKNNIISLSGSNSQKNSSTEDVEIANMNLDIITQKKLVESYQPLNTKEKNENKSNKTKRNWQSLIDYKKCNDEKKDDDKKNKKNKWNWKMFAKNKKI